jgi:predicted dehydrogenase
MLRAAVVGLGWWGKKIISYLNTSQYIKVTHGVDLQVDQYSEFIRLNHLVAVKNLDDVLSLKDVDAVILVTPHRFHEEQALKIIASGKHIFCEKPLALSCIGAKKIIDACLSKNLILGIGHERRFETGLEELLKAVTNGTLGQILHLDANVSHNLFAKMDASNWRVQVEHAPAGAMTALGVHLTDFFISLMGCPSTVRAKTAKVLANAVANDQVLVQLDFPSGATASITCLSTTPYHGRITIFGNLGWMEVKENGNVDWGLPSELTITNSEAKRTYKTFPATNVVLKNFDSWARAIQGKEIYRYTNNEIYNNIRVLEAIVFSSNNDSKLVHL